MNKTSEIINSYANTQAIIHVSTLVCHTSVKKKLFEFFYCQQMHEFITGNEFVPFCEF